MLDAATSEILQQVAQIGETRATPIKAAPNLPTTRVSLRAGLPPVPAKLVSKIEAGEFIDMGKLLPDCVGISGPEDATGESSSERCTVSSILE